MLAAAKSEGRPVMIDFFAEWCAACKELDRETYPALEVIEESGRFLSIKVDATQSDDALDALMERFGVEGLPTVAFVSLQRRAAPGPEGHRLPRAGSFVVEMKKVD